MYHAVLCRRIRSLRDSMSRGDTAPVLAAFAPDATHVFIGAHAMSGRRVTPEGIRAWYARLRRRLPDLRFTAHRIGVAGPPWATLAVVERTETNSATDGVETSAQGVHVLHLRWGQITRMLILTDRSALQATLDRSATTSGGESLAPAIDARPGWPRP